MGPIIRIAAGARGAGIWPMVGTRRPRAGVARVAKRVGPSDHWVEMWAALIGGSPVRGAWSSGGPLVFVDDATEDVESDDLRVGVRDHGSGRGLGQL